jgi:putative resolvase
MELLRAVAGGQAAGGAPGDAADMGGQRKIPVTWVGRERRFSSDDVDALKAPGGGAADRPRLEGLYVRVSGTTGQESSLEAQEAELRATTTGTVARVFRDRASGLREDPTVEVLHPKARGGREELLEDFVSLVTTASART